MKLANARDQFVEEFTFPVERQQVLASLGDVEIDGPTENPDTVAEVLERTDVEVFDSADELFDTLIGLLSSEYVGRQFYDDRGSNVGMDIDEVSL